jgi:DNA processing protein
VGPGRFAVLMKRFGSVDAILGAPVGELSRLPGFGPEMARRVAEAGSHAGLARARDAQGRMDRVGAVAILPHDDAYPEPFRQLADPPFILFACGDLAPLATPGVGMVGTRHPTAYGRQAAALLARELASVRCPVVSGMAKGIDAAAHAAALEEGGPTIGVLGAGIDRSYPPENARLFTRMREKGTLITEMPPGEEPNAGNFPRRNRLISALSAAVVVVEMGDKSGARHTVDYALELGREVFAVPGPITSPASAGTNALLRDGARVATCARDLLEVMHGVGFRLPDPLPQPEVVQGELAMPSAPRLPGDEAVVLDAIGDAVRHVDGVAGATQLPPNRILAALLSLELRGLVESLPGKQYRRA